MIRLEDLLNEVEVKQKVREEKKTDVYGIPKGTFVILGGEKKPVSEKVCQQYYLMAKILLAELEQRGIPTTLESCFNVLWGKYNPKPNLALIEHDLNYELSFLKLKREEIVSAIEMQKKNQQES